MKKSLFLFIIIYLSLMPTLSSTSNSTKNNFKLDSYFNTKFLNIIQTTYQKIPKSKYTIPTVILAASTFCYIIINIKKFFSFFFRPTNTKCCFFSEEDILNYYKREFTKQSGKILPKNIKNIILSFSNSTKTIILLKKPFSNNKEEKNFFILIIM